MILERVDQKVAGVVTGKEMAAAAAAVVVVTAHQL
jgi:hypothetical protein